MDHPSDIFAGSVLADIQKRNERDLAMDRCKIGKTHAERGITDLAFLLAVFLSLHYTWAAITHSVVNAI